ncbi:helicase-associated domain-containing protein [Candidatus Sumerlaeota bacterium]|nr:helicase-associated domain-containing protein [Candidatus Sumerlaeota bacterium]
MRLKSVLKTLNSNKLSEIARFWNIPLPDLSNLSEKQVQSVIIENIYPRMQNQHYFNLAFKQLEEDEKELVYFLTIHGGELPRKECLQRFFHNDENRLIKLVNTLTLKGFVFFDHLVEMDVDDILIGIPDSYFRFIDLPSHWVGYLGYFLRELSLYHLRAIAHVGLKMRVDSNKKSFFIYKIRNALLDPQKLQHYLNNLPDNEGKMFRKIVAKKGIAVYHDLLDTGTQKRYDHTRADYINNLLSYSGLVFVALPDSNKYNSLLMVPRDLMYIINHRYKRRDTRSIKDLDVLTLPSDGKPPQFVLENSNNILRDIVIFVSFINRNALRVLSSGGIGKNDLKKALPFISSHKTVKYLAFIALFCIQKKFIVDAGGVWKVAGEFEKWLRNPQKCYTDLFKFWLETSAWNEEYIEGDTIHPEVTPENLVDIINFRKIVLKEIENIPYNRWVYFKTFADTVLPRIEINLPRRGSQFVMERFNRSNYLVLESVIAESLFWLGIISLGVRKESDLARLGNRTTPISGSRQSASKARKTEEIVFYFKLTELGRFVLESDYQESDDLFKPRSDYEVPPISYDGDYLIVQANLDVVVPPDFRLSDFYILNKFTSITSVDVMSTLTITKESIRQAMDQGLSGEDILEFLTTRSRQPLPDTVEHLIDECSESHGGISLGAVGGYIHVEDPILLAELLSYRKLKNLIREIVDEKLVLLNPDVDIKKVAKELQNLGFMPRLETDTIRQTPTGEYHIALNKEDLYNLIAIVKLVARLEKELKSDFTDKKASSLIELLKPTGTDAYNIDKLAESISKTFHKNYDSAFKKKVNELTSRYKKQLSRLMTVSVVRTPSKFAFNGPNPATKASDIKKLLEFATENELEVKLTYKKSPRDIIEETVEPDSIDLHRLYGYCKDRDSYCVYSLQRVVRAQLI